MRAVAFIAILVSILGACSSSKDTSETIKREEVTWRQDTVVLSFERTACFGMCPTFKADLYGDGKVNYHGINNVDNKGHFIGELEAGQLDMLYKKAEAIGFFNMEDKYDGNITDIPSQIYFIEMHGKKKTIYARYKKPKELDDFGTILDGVLEGIEWRPVENIDH